MKKVRQFLRHRFTPRPIPADPHWQYEVFKQDWIANNPDATPEQYAAAMQRIARELRI